MKFLVLNADYGEFLSWLYRRNRGLECRRYEEQLAVRHGTLFGDGGFYSSNLRKLGHDAHDIYVNNEPLQRAWARQYDAGIAPEPRWHLAFKRGFVPWISRAGDQRYLENVIKAQILYHRPDVVINHAVNAVGRDVLRSIKPYVPLLVAQIASPLRQPDLLALYDLVVTSSPHLFNHFVAAGLNVEFVHLGFECAILTELPERNPDIPASFVGSFHADHTARTRFLEQVCQHPQVNVWGNGAERLPRQSPIRAKYRGPAWGTEMYQILRRSKVTINHHTDIAGAYASNMRLYEATGVGTMLLTDWKDNLKDLFDVGRDVVAYRSAEECKELLSYYLTHDAERETIALSGQRRTLAEHNYHGRMTDLAGAVKKNLGRVS